MKRVLVTGCSGFVGRTCCEALTLAGYSVRGAGRLGSRRVGAVADTVVVGEIRRDTDWREALLDVDFVVHLAARAHVINDTVNSGGLYDEINEFGTRRLAEAAAAAGVRRFVYLSSVKVNGEESTTRPFTAADEPRPVDAYGRSKWLGEKALLEIARKSRMEATIVRSPLVYGPGVRANFLRLMQCVDRLWPLPLGGIRNSRSLVSIWNLTDLIVHVLEHVAAPGNIWMVSDGEDLSTPALVRRIGRAMNRKVWLPRVPVSMLQLGAALLKKQLEMARLCGSLSVDIDRTRRELNWIPPVTVDESLARTVTWYLSEKRSRDA